MTVTAVAIRDVALSAWDAGLCVVPPMQDGTKRPITEWVSLDRLIDLVGEKRARELLKKPDDHGAYTWIHWQHERSSREQVANHYATDQRTGFGLVTGRVSGNLELLEIEDPETWRTFVDTAEASGLINLVKHVANGYTSRSAGGGYHLLWRCDTIEGNQKLARRPGPVDEITGRPTVEVLIETRGEGGFTVEPPSHGSVHPSGEPYRLLRGGVGSIVTITPEERAALLNLARAFDEMPQEQFSETRGSTANGVTGGRPGDDFNERATWSEILEPHGWTFLTQRGDKGIWCRPGKQDGVSATTNHASSGYLYVFSSSTIFEPERGYSKFSAYAMLNYGGDFAAAAKELASQGYGQRSQPSSNGPSNGRQDVDVPTAADSPIEPKRFRLTDTGNAERLVYRHGEMIRHNWGRGVWNVHDGKRWAVDQTGRLEQLAKDTVRAIPQEAKDQADEEYAKILKWAASSESDGKRQAMIRLARSEDGIAIQPADLDADPWKLNVDNGTIDLHTKQRLPHSRQDYITRLIPIPYDPDAKCPTFDAFLDRIFDHDQDLIGYVWRLIGYSLTGSIREQILPVCWGTGANGKSTLLATIRDLLGDYAAEADAESFMEQRNEGIREDIAALDGARFVSAVETTDGRRLSEALVKKLTGGERLRARRLYENGYEFLPQFKVWLATNHRPEIRGTEHAIWRRIRLIPFNVTIPDNERDNDLPEKLRAEFPGILARAVEGCYEWQHTGLSEPRAVTNATAAYRHDMDILADWIEDRCILRRGVEATAKALYEDYTEWCESQGLEAIKQRTFGQRLTDRGCGERKSGSKRYRTGIALLSDRDTGDERDERDTGDANSGNSLKRTYQPNLPENTSQTSQTSQTDATDDWEDI